MKKYISILAIAIATLCLSACGRNTVSNSANNSENSSENNSKNQLQIVTTIFPEYDWVREILGDHISKTELTLLLDNGVDMHSYQPTAEDILKISNCNLFIYVGGESDEWVEDALREAVNPDMQVINLLDVLGDTVKEEEVVEGMETEAHEHEDGEEEHEEEEHEHEDDLEYDEHVWLSLKNAVVICDAIAEVLVEIDPACADDYKANVASYNEKLSSLDSEYQMAADTAKQKTLLFADRFPFRYLVDDYGLSYYAAFAGCSAETEASFETITFLAGKADELGLGNILTIEKSDQKMAQTIVQNTQDKNQQILTLDSMQSTTSKDVENGAAYLSIMENNLDVLKETLK